MIWTVLKAIGLCYLALGVVFTAGVCMGHMVSERKRQRRSRDEFLYLMETEGYESERQARYCQRRIDEGDYYGAVVAMKRGLFV